jgi:hypothetical protein
MEQGKAEWDPPHLPIMGPILAHLLQENSQPTVIHGYNFINLNEKMVILFLC